MLGGTKIPACYAAAAVAAVIMLLARPCLGHVDTVIEVRDNGELSGLPPQYMPASVLVEYGQGMQWSRRVLRLTISLGSSKVTLPQCLTAAFELGEGQQLQFAASWYHDPLTLPPYLAVRFPTESHKLGTAGHTILLNLDSLEIIQVVKSRAVDDTLTYERFSPDSFCHKDKGRQNSTDSRHY